MLTNYYSRKKRDARAKLFFLLFSYLFKPVAFFDVLVVIAVIVIVAISRFFIILSS